MQDCDLEFKLLFKDYGAILVTRKEPTRGSARSPRSLHMILAAVGALASSSAARADWAPPPPMPDEFDWVQLKSGEWLKGEIHVMYDDSLEFDSEELDLLDLDLDDVTMIRSAQVMNVRLKGNRTAIGKLLVEGNRVTVIGVTQAGFDRAELLSITAGEPKEINYWTGKVSLGGNFRSGNSEQTEISGSLRFQRRTVENRVTMDYLGNFTRNNGVESSNNHRFNATWDRFLSDRIFLRPVFGEYFRDPFQNIAYRYTVGTGAGYQILDTSRTDWMVFAGPAYQETKFEEIEPGADNSEGTPAASIGTVYDTEITGWLDFIYDYRLQFTSEAAGRYNHHMVGTFEIDLPGELDLDLSLVWDRIQKPKTNADGTVPEQDDYRLILGIGYDF